MILNHGDKVPKNVYDNKYWTKKKWVDNYIEENYEKPHYTLIKQLTTDKHILDFCNKWREHFLECMKPQF